MPALRKTPFVGTITWLGVVHDSSTDIRAQSAESLDLTLAGQEGECHAGLTRPSCSRVLDLYPKKNTVIRNTRQLTILSAEEIQQIATNLHIHTTSSSTSSSSTSSSSGGNKAPLDPTSLDPTSLDPTSLGASMVLEGIPDLSHLPPNSRLLLDNQDGTALTIDLENEPCMYTGQVVHADHPSIGHWNRFKPAAAGLRGVTAWVERAGSVRVGDRVTLFVPSQRPWALSDTDTDKTWSGSVRRIMMRMSVCGGVVPAPPMTVTMTALTAHLLCMLLAGMGCAAVGLMFLHR